jgi:hypothetical protein
MSAARTPFGQVARLCGRLGGWGLNVAFRLAFALLVIVVVAAGGLALRLAQGPLPLPWLATALENAANTADQATRVDIGGVALVWDPGGFDRPVELHLSAIRLTDPQGGLVAALPEAAVGLSLRALLLGRITARSVALRGLDLRLLRGADDTVAIDLGTQGERLEAPGAGSAEADGARGGGAALAYVLGLLTGPDDGPFGRQQLRHVSLRGARLAIADAALRADWSLPNLNIDLWRTEDGLEAEGGATLQLGAEAAHVGVAGQWRPGAAGTAVAIRVGAVRPASLAAASPRLAPLAMVDAMLTANIRLQFGPDFRPQSAAAAIRLGAGRLVVPGSAGIPIRSAAMTLAATPDRLDLTDAVVVLDIAGGGAPPVLSANASLRLGEAPLLTVNAALPRFDLAELAHVWPPGLGRNERAWLVPNVTAGVASDVVLALEASLPADLSDLVPGRMDLQGRAEGITVHYLRPMPPAIDASGRFRVSLQTVEVDVESARIGRALRGRGQVRLTSLDAHPQYADIVIDLAAPVAEVIGLLQHPKLKLFESRPIPPAVRDATGAATGKLTVRFPLLNELAMDDVRVGVEGQVTDGMLPRLLAGQDLTEARLAFSVNNEGIRLAGPVRLAGTPASVTYEQDFRAGPPAQVIERIRAEARAEERLLVALGLSSDGRITGALATTVAMTARRNGQAEATIRADLRDARISLPEAGFEKPPGQPGTAEATLRLARERITALENVRIDAPSLAVRGRVGFANGTPERITFSSLTLNRTRATGEISFGRDGAISVTARGAELDASPLFAPAAETASPAPDPPSRGPPLRLDLGFERVWLANQRSAEGVSVRLDRRAGRIEQLSLSGRTGPDQQFEATVARRADGRSLMMRANDAGAFLAATDVITSMTGGRLSVEGRFDEASDALSGNAELTDFRMRDAPAIGRLLQGMTLYGLLDVARGPGLNFSRASVPFTWAEGVLTLADARAFSPSLGVTVKGRIDTRARRLDLEGTVVPAYFFNSLLGNIPLIGRLFSPERGGGVFAATYSARGPMADPQVSVNPLAALTPGFLRGLFGIFDAPAAPAPPADPATSDRQPTSRSPPGGDPAAVSPLIGNGNAGVPPG